MEWKKVEGQYLLGKRISLNKYATMQSPPTIIVFYSKKVSLRFTMNNSTHPKDRLGDVKGIYKKYFRKMR